MYHKSNGIKQKSNLPLSVPTVSSTNTPPAVAPSVSLGSTYFSYDLITVYPDDTIRLIPNFTEKQPAFHIRETHACAYAANGGFYDTQGKPLGFFVSDGKTLGHIRQNTLTNGFFWLKDFSRGITLTPPDIPVDFILQTGPVLHINSQDVPLHIRNDEHRRRVAATIDTDNIIRFIVVFKPDTVFSGPLLEDLPKAVTAIAKQEGFSLSTSVNLDGGSASAFYGPRVRLSELTPVGSLFCIQKARD